jgi:hypothetical protein
MRRALRIVTALTALFPLASALAVLISNLVDPGYRAFYRDPLWLVVGYLAFWVVVVVAAVRDARLLVPWLAVVRALAGWAFLAAFLAVGRAWMAVTPGRYVYQLFDVGEAQLLPLYAFVFLGRGAGNTLVAFALTSPWWRPLRTRQPLLGRLVTAVPIALTVLAVWAFLQLVRLDAQTYSPEAFAVAHLVGDGLDCDAVRTRSGQTTTDVRQRGDRQYHVTVVYGCPETRVLVLEEDGRRGTASVERPECCPAAP